MNEIGERYEVLFPLEYQGKKYEVGDVVVLPKREAIALLSIKQVEVYIEKPKGKKK